MSQKRTDNCSLANLFQSLSLEEKLARLQTLEDDEVETFLYDWKFWARPDQLPPKWNWRTWLILAGRGWGKTRTGAEQVKTWAHSGKIKRIALVGQTAADVRDVMIEGESGILAVAHPRFKPQYIPSKRAVIWPNGMMAQTFSADTPDQLRGPQFEAAWGDEVAKWSYREAWDNLAFGLRLGANPQVVVTTTPIPSPLIKELVKADGTHLTRGSTYENEKNLAKPFLEAIKKRYEGTRLGRQELHAEILEDNPGALWNMSAFENNRLDSLPLMKRIVVAIDPAVSVSEGSDETGIIVCGLTDDDRGIVLEDRSGKYSPFEWANVAVGLYYKWSADKVIAEKNQGGDLVEQNLRIIDKNLSIKTVHAKKGKYTRAEPVAALYEKGRVHHYGIHAQLESQMCDFVHGSANSPDRMDALVYALTELMIKGIEWEFI